MNGIFILLISLVPAQVAPVPPRAPQEEVIVVTAASVQSEIERILLADNVDTIGKSPRAVVAVMAAIPRGNAPDDFWESYQRHLEAWRELARISATRPSRHTLAAADRRVNATFDEVERIARSYDARLPRPIAGN